MTLLHWLALIAAGIGLWIVGSLGMVGLWIAVCEIGGHIDDGLDDE